MRICLCYLSVNVWYSGVAILDSVVSHDVHLESLRLL
jgi:hypothetical protein